VLNPVMPMMPGGAPDNDRMRDMMGDMMMGRRDWNRETLGLDRLVITDTAGTVLWNNSEYREDILSPEGRRSVAIRHRGRNVGYLYLGRMIPDIAGPPEISLIRSVGVVTWIVAGFVFLIALALGSLLTRHIIRPVKILNRAAGDVESGRLDTRVPDSRKDEMGDLSRSFNSMTASLESADRQRRRLVADSAHELRTPVSLIRARIEMMEEGVYPMDAVNLAALSDEAQRLSRLVDELKLLSELESPVYTPDIETVELGGLLKDAVSAAEPVARREGLVISTSFDEALYASVDRDHLHRLAANLISNALRHAEGQIRVSAARRNREVKIMVEDDGPGIPEDWREKVFERYFRGDASRNRESGGSGLGLAICLEIARAHRGTITVGESESLGGAEFSLTIPLA
jgi:two-component system sensor histidine kinase BaeS